MYSNTIYILNNTIIECFDIAFSKTKQTKIKQKQKSYFMLQKRKGQPPFRNNSMMRKLPCDLLERELFCRSRLATESQPQEGENQKQK